MPAVVLAFLDILAAMPTTVERKHPDADKSIWSKYLSGTKFGKGER